MAGRGLMVTSGMPPGTLNLSTQPTPNVALHNFKLLEALRSDDPAKVKPFLDELRPSSGSVEGQEDAAKAGKILGMAVRVASGTFCLVGLFKPLSSILCVGADKA